jgi:hypothetical protein
MKIHHTTRRKKLPSGDFLPKFIKFISFSKKHFETLKKYPPIRISIRRSFGAGQRRSVKTPGKNRILLDPN